MNKHIVETITGAIVLMVAVWSLFVFINKTSTVRIASDDYVIKAKFQNVDGIEQGSPVKISGVKVGVVVARELDYQNYFAVLSLAIDKKVKLPTDSVAKVSSEGLLGNKYLSLIPGGDDKMLDQNDEIKFTQSSVNLETLIGKMIFSKGQSDQKQSD